MDERAPVFVKIDEYKDIADIMTLMREKLRQAKFLLDKIAELKAQEDAELATWAKELEDVEERVGNVDKALSEPSI
jgi:phage host-nuclease inhibitor protein Gam